MSNAEEWLSLWSSGDICYWVSTSARETDPAEEISIIYGDRKRLAARVKRLASSYPYAQHPKSLMRRVISNVEVDEADEGKVTT